MPFLRRQVAVRTVQGIVSALPSGTVFPYRLTDVLPKYVLKLDAGTYSSDTITLNASDSFAIPVPAAYDSANRIACFMRCTARCKVVIVDPELGTSTFLVKSTSGTTDGDHKGILMWQGRVTSITVSIPAAFADCIIDYWLWDIPDLALAASWQNGIQALGVVP